MPAADPPAVVVTVPVAKPPEMVVVSRDAHSDVLVSSDTPLALIKAGRTEEALLRQVIVLTSTLTVARPAGSSGEDVLRWTYQPYLQRQLCFTSITGLFSCAGVEGEDLTERASGETPLATAPALTAPGQAAPGPNPSAEAARVAVVTALHDRSAALFETDRRLKLDPMLKAAGVAIRKPHVSTGPARH